MDLLKKVQDFLQTLKESGSLSADITIELLENFSDKAMKKEFYVFDNMIPIPAEKELYDKLKAQIEEIKKAVSNE